MRQLPLLVACAVASLPSAALASAHRSADSLTAFLKPVPAGAEPVETPELQPGGLTGRIGANRAKLVKDWGGTAESEEAVARGLRWLADQQLADGRWKLDGDFPDPGTPPNDSAATAMALLPFLGCGKTHRSGKDEEYAAVVDKGLKFLLSKQNANGTFSDDGYVQALCTIAVCEAFALSKDAALKKPAQAALDRLVTAQHSAGGWRYKPGQAGDTSVTGWCVMGLRTGLTAGLNVPVGTIRKAQNFLDGVLDAQTEGYGYLGAQPTPTMTAVALLCRQNLQGWGPQNGRLIKGIENYIKPNSPNLARKDVYYDYYATQVMHHFGGDDWKTWNAKMRDILIKTQETAENKQVKGSWSPKGDAWGRNGGRLMETSLKLLTLEVYYRHVSLSSKKADAAP
jgi:hypothetical protein